MNSHLRHGYNIHRFLLPPPTSIFQIESRFFHDLKDKYIYIITKFLWYSNQGFEMGILVRSKSMLINHVLVNWWSWRRQSLVWWQREDYHGLLQISMYPIFLCYFWRATITYLEWIHDLKTILDQNRISAFLFVHFEKTFVSSLFILSSQTDSFRDQEN